MCDYTQDIEKLFQYVDCRFFEPKANWEEGEFKKRCIEMWACDDILKNCSENITVDPREIAKGFVERMELYEEICQEEKLATFVIAREAANELLKFIN